MSIQKKIIEERGLCEVLFRLTDSFISHPKKASLVGDYNRWNPTMGEMEKSANGYFEKKIQLQLGRDYQFRYLIDGYDWENDWQADAYVSTPYGSAENMVIICDLPGDE